jgi:hydrogenase maturation protease
VTPILVAGIGNIFNGDDAFGVEVVRRLSQRRLPPGVRVVDFGIRGIDLVYALLDGDGAVVMIDAVQRGELPGTVSLIEPEQPENEASAEGLIAPQELDPASVIRLAAALGAARRRMLLVSCEPQTLGGDEGVLGLSAPVTVAVDVATDLVEQLIDELIADARETDGAALRQASGPSIDEHSTGYVTVMEGAEHDLCR